MSEETLPGRVAAERQAGSSSRKKLLLWSALATAIVFGLLAWQCGSALMAGSKLSDAAVEHFHNQFNAGAYEQIYSEATPEFQQSDNKQDVLAFFQKIHERLGDARTAKRTGLNATSGTSGTFITATYETEFSGGKAVETFQWRSQGGQLRMLNYHIESRDLIMK